MNYTDYELKIAKSLIKQIGFTDENTIIKILEYYDREFGYSDFEILTRTLKNRKGQKYLKEYWQKTIKNDICIEKLKLEVELRNKCYDIEILRNNKSEYISATDLANFIFCPASYSITKSFKIDKFLNNSKILKGTKLHDELRLIYKNEVFGFNNDYISRLFSSQINIIKKIKSCTLIFKGHSDSDKTFVNNEKKFIGKPDYIFLDPNNNYFIVEEKYHYCKPNENTYTNQDNFYTNNKIQLQSYIEYIKDFELFHKQWLYINLYLLFLNYFSLIVHLKQYLKNSHLQNIDLKSYMHFLLP